MVLVYSLACIDDTCLSKCFCELKNFEYFSHWNEFSGLIPCTLFLMLSELKWIAYFFSTLLACLCASFVWDFVWKLFHRYDYTYVCKYLLKDLQAWCKGGAQGASAAPSVFGRVHHKNHKQFPLDITFILSCTPDFSTLSQA